MADSKVRIVSNGDSSRVAASSIFLNDQDITHLVKDVKVYWDHETRRWHAEFAFNSHVEIDISAITEIKASAQGKE